MKTLFLTEGGKKIGFGHITRCKALSQALNKLKPGAEIQFIIQGNGYAGEFFYDARPGLGVKPLPIPPLTKLDRRRHIDFDKASSGLDSLPNHSPRRAIRRDGRTDGDTAVLGDLGSDIADTADVQSAVLFAKAEFRGQVFTNYITV